METLRPSLGAEEWIANHPGVLFPEYFYRDGLPVVVIAGAEYALVGGYVHPATGGPALSVLKAAAMAQDTTEEAILRLIAQHWATRRGLGLRDSHPYHSVVWPLC